MKKILFIFTLTLCFLGFVAIGISQTGGPNPDDQLAQIKTLHTEFSVDVNAVYNTYMLDYHPYYGYVGINDMPVHPGGWDDQYLPDLFPGQTIMNYEKELTYLTGRVLMQHKDTYGVDFYVWHEIQNEPMLYFRTRTYDQWWYELWRVVRPACGNDVAVYIDGIHMGYLRDGQFVPWYM